MSIWGAIGTAVGAVVGGPAGAAIGGSLGGALDQSNATRDAQRSSQAATDATVGEQRRQFDLQRQDSLPYRETGHRALNSLESSIDQPITAAEVMQDPGYQFGMTEGQRAIDRKIAASGGRVSGAAIRAAGRFGTDYASTGYGAAYQRRQDRLNRLAALAGIGQTSTANSAAAGQSSTNAITAAIQSQGDANAAATLARGNIWADTGNQIAALYGRNRGGSGSSFGSTLDSFFNGTGGSGD